MNPFEELQKIRVNRAWMRKNSANFTYAKEVFKGIFGEDEYIKLKKRYQIEEIIYKYLKKANKDALSVLNLTASDILKGGGAYYYAAEES